MGCLQFPLMGYTAYTFWKDMHLYPTYSLFSYFIKETPGKLFVWLHCNRNALFAATTTEKLHRSSMITAWVATHAFVCDLMIGCDHGNIPPWSRNCGGFCFEARIRTRSFTPTGNLDLLTMWLLLALKTAVHTLCVIKVGISQTWADFDWTISDNQLSFRSVISIS